MRPDFRAENAAKIVVGRDVKQETDCYRVAIIESQLCDILQLP